VQQVAVMLGEADDRGPRARLEVRERGELLVLLLLEVRVNGPAVRAALGMSELLVDPLDHVLGECVPEGVGVDVRLGGGVAHEVGEQPLDDAVLAHDALGALPARRRQQGLLVLAALDQPFALEPLQHLPGRCARDAEHLGHTRGERGGAAAERPVLPDREGEEVDRLEVLVDRVALRHSWVIVACKVTLT
jgi:hypothetical protein